MITQSTQVQYLPFSFFVFINKKNWYNHNIIRRKDWTTQRFKKKKEKEVGWFIIIFLLFFIKTP